MRGLGDLSFASYLCCKFSRLAVFKIAVFSLLFSLNAASLYAAEVSCPGFLKLIMDHKDALTGQMTQVAYGKQKKVDLPIYDAEIASILGRGYNSETHAQVEKLLVTSGTLDIPVRSNGAVVAAPTSGGYGKAIWIRDLARVFDGLLALGRKDDARKVAKAILAAMTTPQQVQRLHANILDTSLHFSGGDEQMKVLHIRMSAEDFGPVLVDVDSVKVEEQWNHKQNDALALSFLAVLSAFREGLLTSDDLEPVERQYLAALPTYFERLEFWNKWDGGAWEEGNGLRVSSVALVTKVFEELYRMQVEIPQSNFALMIKHEVESGAFPSEVHSWVKRTHQISFIQSVMAEGLSTVRRLLVYGESPHDGPNKDRHREADAALAHLFWYPLDALSEEDYRMVLKHVLSIARDAGVIRYQNDLYLHTLYYYGLPHSEAIVPPEFLAVDRTVTLGEIAQVFHPRQPQKAEELFGKDLEPQWAIHYPILARAGLFMYRKFGRPEYLELAELCTIHSFAAVTPNVEIPTLDGSFVAKRKVPESRSPFWITRREDGVVKERFRMMVPSNNSPLYWATAELARLNREWATYRHSLKIEYFTGIQNLIGIE